MIEPLKKIQVVAAVIIKDAKLFATQRADRERKDWLQFPGRKIEPAEAPKEALKREIREELAAEIEVGDLLTTVDYDYPKFHLTMQCYLCHLKDDTQPQLLEHEAARWLEMHELKSVRWLPADDDVIENLVAMAPIQKCDDE